MEHYFRLIFAIPAEIGVIYEGLIAETYVVVLLGVSTFLLTSKQDIK